MNPKLIKLSSGDTIYCNQDMITYIKQTLAQTSGEIKPGDNLFFFKNVKFKRDRLDVSAEKFNRTILMDKANAVVISDIGLPIKGLPLKNGKIIDVSLMHEADEVIFNISAFGASYMRCIQQWYELSQLKNKPVIIHEGDLLKYINSGMLIDESNLESILSMIQNDVGLAANVLDNCDIVSSIEYITYIFYFSNLFNSQNTALSSRCDNCMRILRVNSCGNSVSETMMQKMVAIPYLKEQLTAEYIKKVVQLSTFQELEKFVNIDINLSWK